MSGTWCGWAGTWSGPSSPRRCAGTWKAASSPTATRPWFLTEISGVYTAVGICLAAGSVTPTLSMSKSASPSDSNSAPLPVDQVGVNMDEYAKGLWDKNRNFILGGFALVVLLILGWGGWNYFTAQREQGIEQDYANATGPESLRAFVQAHPDHPLAALAQLKVADAAYEAGQTAEAQAAYQQALDKLPAGIFASRARLGLAICQLQSGQA